MGKLPLHILILSGIFALNCQNPVIDQARTSNVEVVILGITQDGGYPQANCEKECCLDHFQGVIEKKYVGLTGHC